MEGAGSKSTRRGHFLVQLLVGFLIGACVGTLAYFATSALLYEGREAGIVAPTSGDSNRSSLGDTTNKTELQDLHALFGASNASQLAKVLDLHVDGISRDKLIGLIDQSVELKQDSLAFEIQEALLAKLAQFDPEQALEKAWTFPASRWSKLINVVFSEWAVLSPQVALERASELTGTLRESAIHAILDEMGEISEQDLADDAKTIAAHRIAEDKALELISTPAEAWEQVVRDNVRDHYQEELLLKIADRWLQEGSLDVLNRVYRDGPLEPFTTSYPLRQQIEALVVELDPQGAWEFVLSMPIEKQREAATGLLRTIARDDPEAAFELIGQLPTIWNRNSAQWAVLQEWAEQTPQELLDRILDFPQQLRQDIVLRALGSIARKSPMQAAEQLQLMKLALGDIDEESVFAVIRAWVEVDPIAASKWAKESYDVGSRVRARVMQRIVYALAQSNPEEAMTMALAEEPHSWNSGSGLEMYVIESMVYQGELEQAIEMLDRVREPSLSMSMYHLGTAFIRARKSTEAIQLADRLSEEAQVEYFESLVYAWMTSNPLDLVDKISTMPSDRVRSEIAKNVLSTKDYSTVTLTDAQIGRLEGYVIEENPTEETN